MFTQQAGAWRDSTDGNGVWLYPQSSEIVAIEYGHLIPFIQMQDFYAADETESGLYLTGQVRGVLVEGLELPNEATQGSVIIDGQTLSFPQEFSERVFALLDNKYADGIISVVTAVDFGAGADEREYIKQFEFVTFPQPEQDESNT